jgi:hypothetical protein
MKKIAHIDLSRCSIFIQAVIGIVHGGTFVLKNFLVKAYVQVRDYLAQCSMFLDEQES